MSPVLEFSVRTSTPDPFDDVRRCVEKAFNREFADGEYELVPAFVSRVLGMTIGLYRWGPDYLLESRIEDLRFLAAAEKKRLVPVTISAPVANMLSIVGPYRWRVATAEDEARDRVVAAELDELMLEDEGPPSWFDGV